MTGVLKLESLTRGNTLKQGDKTPLKYRLFDADGDALKIAGKPAKVRLAYPGFVKLGYEKDGLVVAQDDTVTFTIDNVIPARIYHIEIIVDGKFIFPSRADEANFTVDKSSLGAETTIIEIVGKDVLVREVKEQVKIELEPFLGGVDEVELTNYATKDYVATAVSDIPAPDMSDYVVSSRVLTDVPADAKFTDTTYTAGAGINIAGDVISATGGGGSTGDSSVEVEEARVDASGHTNATLKERLDKEYSEIDTQLAQKVDLGSKVELEDLSSTVLSAIEGGEGTDFNLLSIPQDYSVTPTKTSFVKMGANLFNIDTITPNVTMSGVAGNRGELVPEASRSVSDFIPVEPNSNYVSSGSNQSILAQRFDADKNPVSTMSGSKNVSTTATVRFVRLSVMSIDLDTIQFESGGTATPYQKYGIIKIPDLAIEELDEVSNKVKEIESSPILQYLMSPNLFNTTTITPNVSLSAAIRGDLIPSETRSVSDFIPVEPNSNYVSSGSGQTIQTQQFDANKSPVSSLSSSKNISTAANVRFVRISVMSDDLDTIQLEPGGAATPYQKYGSVTIPNLTIEGLDEIINRLEALENPSE